MSCFKIQGNPPFEYQELIIKICTAFFQLRTCVPVFKEESGAKISHYPLKDRHIRRYYKLKDSAFTRRVCLSLRALRRTQRGNLSQGTIPPCSVVTASPPPSSGSTNRAGSGSPTRPAFRIHLPLTGVMLEVVSLVYSWGPVELFIELGQQ